MATEKFIVHLHQPFGEFNVELGVFETIDEAKKFAEDYKAKCNFSTLQTIVDMCNASPESIYYFGFSDFKKLWVELEIVKTDFSKWIYLETYFLMPDDLKEKKDLWDFFRSLGINPFDINFVE